MTRCTFFILLSIAVTSIGCGQVNLKCSPGKTSCASGCTDVTTDGRNCGGCDKVCSDGQTCTNGSCTCAGGLTACGTTCSDTTSDPANCGACGNACSTGASCTAGVCGCPTGQNNCSGTCTDLQTDAANCGTCGNACPNGDGCSNGSCGCGTLSTCSATCVDEQTDNNHCGNCTTVCTAGHTCQAGQCKCTTAGQTDCGGTCVNEQTDPMHCGTCSTVCGGGKTCQAGACQCPAGQTDCSGTCVNEQTDSMHCGTCTTVCAGGKSCMTGTCQCGAGQTDCSGTCVNEQNDNNHCGTCTTVCTAGHSCQTGLCKCVTAGQTDCSGTCVNEQNDNNHCGTCTTVCTAGHSCQTGTCKCTAAGQTDCSGTCVDETTDNNHCGTCTTVCSGGMTCQTSMCKCPTGQTNCGGTCFVTTSDRAHCGASCSTCAANQVCNSGSCVTAPAAAFASAPPFGDPTGWTDGASMPIQASLLPTGITGITYQCRTGPPATIGSQAFINCDGSTGATAVDKPPAGANGTTETDYRYIQGAYTSNTVTFQFYAHSSLNGVGKCTPGYTDAQYFAAAQTYSAANPTVFPIPASPLFTADVNLKLKNPFITIPFKQVHKSGPMLVPGVGSPWTMPEPFDYTTKDLSLRHKFVLSADGKLLLLRRNFQASLGTGPGGSGCVNMAVDHSHGSRSPIAMCDVWVVNINGLGLCVHNGASAPAVVPNPNSGGQWVSGWNMIRTRNYTGSQGGLQSTNLCTAGHCSGPMSLLPP